MRRLKQAGKRLRQDIYRLRFALLGIAIYYLVVHFVFGQFCPMQIFFHFPCPGCGMTRALFLVLTGSWEEAWALQPLVFGWVALGVWFGVDRYILGVAQVTTETCPAQSEKASTVKKLQKAFLVVLLVGTLALYVWRLVHGFPERLMGN